LRLFFVFGLFPHSEAVQVALDFSNGSNVSFQSDRTSLYLRWPCDNDQKESGGKTMHKFLLIAIAAVLSCLLSACVVEDRRGDRRDEDRREAGAGRRDARDVCLEQARQTGHNVRRVRDEHAESREIYRVTLEIVNDSQNLYCDYHEDSHVAELHW
jgi:hypothetical protein